MIMLKPCPFCGGSSEIATSRRRYVRALREFICPVYVRCCVCGSTASVKLTVDGAVEAWNRRSGKQSI